MLKKYLLLILVFSSALTYSQKLVNQWLNTIPGNWRGSASNIQMDPSGNFIIDGYFNHPWALVDFNPHPVDEFLMDSAPYGLHYIKKIDSLGNLLWVKSFNLGNYGTKNMILDHNGNIILSGSFGQLADFDPDPINEVLDTSEYGLGGDFYVLKLDNDGNYLWHRSFGSEMPDGVHGIEVDQAGNIYCLGDFGDTIDLDPGIDSAMYYPFTNNSQYDGFILKLSPNGDYIWSKAWARTGFAYPHRIELNSLGELIIAGYYQGSVDLNPNQGTDFHNSGTYRKPFLMNIDTSGSYNWTRTFNNANYTFDYNQIKKSINGKIYSFCEFEDTIQLTVDGTLETYISSGISAGLMIDFDSSGYISNAVHFETSGRMSCSDIEIVQDGIIYSGSFLAGIDFDPGLGVQNELALSYNSDDAFIAKYDFNGEYIWHNVFKAYYGVYIADMEIQGDKLYMVGAYRGDCDFDPDTSELILVEPSSSSFNFYDAMYEMPPSYNSIISEVIQNEKVVIFPNPTSGNLFIKVPEKLEIKKIDVFDQFGKQIQVSVNHEIIDLSGFSKGQYLLRINTEFGWIEKKVILN